MPKEEGTVIRFTGDAEKWLNNITSRSGTLSQEDVISNALKLYETVLDASESSNFAESFASQSIDDTVSGVSRLIYSIADQGRVRQISIKGNRGQRTIDLNQK